MKKPDILQSRLTAVALKSIAFILMLASAMFTVNAQTLNNARLSLLHLSQGQITPSFTPAVTGYSATVANSVTAITVTPTAADVNATIIINGTPVASKTASPPIPLSVGSNNITTVVTAPDGITTKTYTAVITRQPSTTTGLTALMLSAGQLTPGFTANNTSYTAAVTLATPALTITATAADPLETITINGKPVSSGAASASIPLVSGTNNISIKTTAQDGVTTKSYTVSVTKSALTGNAKLSLLHLSAGQITPAFSPEVTDYTYTLRNQDSLVMVKPIAANAQSSIKTNGIAVASGANSQAIALGIGVNTITTVVTAPDGLTTKTYTATVTRPPLTIAGLNALMLNAGQLSPGFTPANTSYITTVALAVSALTITPTATAPHETIRINGSPVISGKASAPIPLTVGTNNILVETTAQDGLATKAYTLVVTRLALTGNAKLSALHISAGLKAPVFDPDITTYTDTVTNRVSSITITPAAGSKQAIIQVNGQTVASGKQSQEIPLVVGLNTINTVVTAHDGFTTQTYTTNIVRSIAYSSNLRQVSVAGNGGDEYGIYFNFDNAVTTYSNNTLYSTTSVKFRAIPDDVNARVTVNGQPVDNTWTSASIPLIIGENLITIKVKSVDGIPKTFIFRFVRYKAVSNAGVLDIKASNFLLVRGANGSTYGEKGFLSRIKTYSATVQNSVSNTEISVMPNYFTSATPSVKVNGLPTQTVYDYSIPNIPNRTGYVISPPIPLAVGQNILNVVTTAEDSVTQKTYTIIVTRQAADDADLLKFSFREHSINVSPAVTPTNYNYTANVPYNNYYTGEIRYTLSGMAAKAVITINGTVYTGQDMPINEGPNYVVIVVTAEDGITKKTYNVTLNRGLSPVADLNSVLLSGTAMQYSGNGFFGTVPASTDSIYVTPCAVDPRAKITVNGVAVISCQATPRLAVKTGANVFAVTVTAYNGVKKRDYTLHITKAAPAAGIANKTYLATASSPGLNQLPSLNVSNNLGAGFSATVADSLGTQPAPLLIRPYPNPFSNVININIGSKVIAKTTAEISYLNNWKVLFKAIYTNKSGIVQLNVANLAPGLYMLRLITDDKQAVFKLVK